MAVGVVLSEGAGVTLLERWRTDGTEIRNDPQILREIVSFISDHAVKTVVATDGIIGCPHEEVIDYPEGGYCPTCTTGLVATVSAESSLIEPRRAVNFLPIH